MFSFLFYFSVSETTQEVFKQVFNDNIIKIEVSGSSKQRINGSMQMTKPEYAIYPWSKRYDWCSNCGKTYDEHPWITFSLDKHKFKFSGYYLKAGCCDYNGCCCEDYGYCIDCCLYSWSLQVSEDNNTWTTVHKVEKDSEMRRCNEKTYKFDKEYITSYIRLIQDEHCPGWPPCLAINQIEFHGVALGDDGSEDFISFHDDDDDVSIIGHISKNGNVKYN